MSERDVWIEKRGSTDLRAMLRFGMDVSRRYAAELLAAERPGWRIPDVDREGAADVLDDVSACDAVPEGFGEWASAVEEAFPSAVLKCDQYGSPCFVDSIDGVEVRLSFPRKESRY